MNGFAFKRSDKHHLYPLPIERRKWTRANLANKQKIRAFCTFEEYDLDWGAANVGFADLEGIVPRKCTRYLDSSGT